MPRGWEFFLTSPYEGVSYIATVLHNAGYPVRIIEVRYDVDPLKSAYDELESSPRLQSREGRVGDSEGSG